MQFSRSSFVFVHLLLGVSISSAVMAQSSLPVQRHAFPEPLVDAWSAVGALQPLQIERLGTAADAAVPLRAVQGRLSPALEQLLRDPASVGRLLQLNAFVDRPLVVRLETFVAPAFSDAVWLGVLVGEPSSRVQVALSGDALVAEISSLSVGRFSIRPAGGGAHHMLEWPLEEHHVCGVTGAGVRSAAAQPAASVQGAATFPTGGARSHPVRKLPPVGGVLSSPPLLPGSGGATLGTLDPPTDPLFVDVLVVYSPAALSLVGGVSAMQALADGHIAYTNGVYADSGVEHRVRLVGLAETAYVESGNLLTDIDRLKKTSDGFMDEVHPLRNSVAADLVSLIVVAGSAGTAYMLDVLDTSFASEAFSALSSASAGLVFAHEVGHNMGLSHNNGPGAPATVFCDAFGHRTVGPQYRTIMSNPPGIRVDFFSNPDLTFDGFALGVSGVGCPSDAADSVRTMKATAPIVAAFR